MLDRTGPARAWCLLNGLIEAPRTRRSPQFDLGDARALAQDDAAGMPELPKGGDVTIALRVSPAHHAQLALVAQIDEITLTDLMQRALDQYKATLVVYSATISRCLR